MYYLCITMVATSRAGIAYPSSEPHFNIIPTPVFSGVRVTPPSIFCVMFCKSCVLFSFGHCVVLFHVVKFILEALRIVIQLQFTSYIWAHFYIIYIIDKQYKLFLSLVKSPSLMKGVAVKHNSYRDHAHTTPVKIG